MRPVIVAETGTVLTDLAPYVPSISDAGDVAFQAALAAGGTGAFVVTGGSVERALGPGDVAGVVSHPDLDAHGRLSAYVERATDGLAVVLVAGGRVSELVATGDALGWIGPAGPTMDDDGRVALRADTVPGDHGVFAADGHGLVEVATSAGGEWAGFQGVPLALPDGGVVFRADRPDGSEAICAWRDGATETVAETGGRFAALGRFPCASAAGEVVFAATLAEGGDVVVRGAAGRADVVLEAGEAFSSFRGALVGGDAPVLVLGTPHGGGLGLFRGEDPVTDRLVAVGDELLGSVVVDLAANPVSVNASGQVVVRVRLADGRQLVLRFDPD